MPIRHDRIRQNRWRQGSILSIEDGKVVLADPTSQARLILVSHDCDIVNPGAREPVVELCISRPIEQLDGNYVRGKNVRTLHVNLEIGGRLVPHVIEASERLRLDRTQLETLVPADDAATPIEELRVVTRWLAKRYERAALPDCFNRRLRPAQEAIRAALRDDGKSLSGVLMALNSEDELQVDQPYRVYVVGLSPKELYDDDEAFASGSRAIARIAAAINECRGIEVEEFEHLSEDDFTLHDLRSVIEYSCEDLSFGENDGASVLPKA